ncbi:YesL family protein [Bacillaceae bacterium Marseille-Q3522]|nr:YesL family protein [Bacillaceae bacterium Marseille-Q3522]
MELGGIVGGLYRACQWCMKLAYLNLLWLAFCLAGLILFGLFPATAAMFSVVRKWMMGESDAPVFRSFLQTYKSAFLTSNGIGFILAGCGYLLSVNFFYSLLLDGWLSIIVLTSLICMSLIYVIIVIYIFPVFVHYQLGFTKYIKHALVSGLTHPGRTLLMIAAVIIYYFVMVWVPGLIPFFSGSILAVILMGPSYQGFRKIDNQAVHKDRLSQQA